MVIRSKLLPPQPHRGVFKRQRMIERLASTYRTPLTLIHAGTGFGKTTELLQLSHLYKKVFWYQVTEPDRDPMLFLAHLVSTCLPDGAKLLERLEIGGSLAAPAVVTALINELTLDLEQESILILDDYHLVSDVTDISRWFEQLVENRPPRLYIALACRKIPDSPGFIRWRVKGNLQVIDQQDLSFTLSEITDLFSEHYHYPITTEQAENIHSYTEGWIIALQMIWQRLQTSRSRQLDRIVAKLPSELPEVFNFLAQEVLQRQPESDQTFLISTAVLRQLDTNACNAILDITNSTEILHSLVERGLFTLLVNETSYRYQRLFQEFLLDQGKNDLQKTQQLHDKAARHYIQVKDYEEAIYHLLAGGNKVAAAEWIERSGPQLLGIGRLRTLSKWIEELDKADLDQHPGICILQGDVRRLRSHFEEAISSYNHAEKVYANLKDNFGRSVAIRRKAQVYLDTIRPLKASSLLENALALLEPQEHPAEVAALLDQLAENSLNLGKPEDARALHNEASMLRKESDPDDIYLEARSLLRTGRLAKAVELLESYQPDLAGSTLPQRPQRFHREMPLLLSLIHLMLGNIAKGEKFARLGIEIGRQLDSPFVEAVGLMRMGHAAQLHPQLPWQITRLEQARDYYLRSIDLVKPFNVVRVQVEPLWGLCRFFGYQGQLAEARKYADQAIEIADSSGDQWFVSLILTSMGTSYSLYGETNQAEDWLTKAFLRAEDVGDSLGRCAAKLALAFNDWQTGKRKEAIVHFDQFLPDLISNECGFLLTTPSFLGMQDPESLAPLLLEAYRSGVDREWLSGLLGQSKLASWGEASYHPGYGLTIRTLGRFEVWRGKTLTSPHEWQREKARQLFQLLVDQKGRWLSREQLTDRIWPDLDPEAASQTLKVALNALNRALEPMREPGASPFFVVRRDNLYAINPVASIVLDKDDFLKLAASDDVNDLQAALSIYQGDYLSDSFLDSWITPARESLHQTYLASALKLARLFFTAQKWDDCIRTCNEILSADPYNEPAFQLLMRCQAARGNRSAIHSIYQRCVAMLREDLDVDPTPETTQLYKTLTRQQQPQGR